MPFCRPSWSAALIVRSVPAESLSHKCHHIWYPSSSPVVVMLRAPVPVAQKCHMPPVVAAALCESSALITDSKPSSFAHKCRISVPARRVPVVVMLSPCLSQKCHYCWRNVDADHNPTYPSFTRCCDAQGASAIVSRLMPFPPPVVVAALIVRSVPAGVFRRNAISRYHRCVPVVVMLSAPVP